MGHALVLALAALFVRLGVWQLSRHDERRERNAAVEASVSRPQVPLGAVLSPGEAAAGDAEFRRVVATGRYDAAREVRIRNRSLDGVAGYHVVTPLVVDEGTAVLVNRGWVPNDVTAPAPPGRDVSVTGLVRAAERRGRLGVKDRPTGTLASLSRIDVARLQQQVRYDLFPAYVQLQAQRPPPGELPRPVPPPSLDAGPHLSYALQWFGFAAVGLVGWPVLLRRVARHPATARRWGPAGTAGHRPAAAGEPAGGRRPQ